MLTERIITLASQYGRYGYLGTSAMLQMEGGRSTTSEWNVSGARKG
jgi:hypothetical protein